MVRDFVLFYDEGPGHSWIYSRYVRNICRRNEWMKGRKSEVKEKKKRGEENGKGGEEKDGL